MALASKVRVKRRLLERLGIRGIAARELPLPTAWSGSIYAFFIAHAVPILLALYVSLTRVGRADPAERGAFHRAAELLVLARDQRFINSILTTFSLAAKTYAGQLGLGWCWH